ncbi:chlorophyllase-1-like [Panicum virgatum]|uniref:chlorophyllase-1-like n=1 Tax=Panicum virgatum TaxID=38727 RepID=UPI0019D663DE|nr:chlorophyllase-1-like [Panicum virgatum]
MATHQQVLEPPPPAVATSVFQPGKLSVELIPVDHDALPAPPIPILIAAPKDAGTYPVAVLLHGFFLQNRFYEQLLRHVASFGFVMVAPQFRTSLVSGGDADDIAAAARVADWLPGGLPPALPAGVEADLSRLALAGHSRGGHTAFALALGHAETALKFSALIGIDPVAGTGRSSQLPPAILTFKPSSLDVAMPVMVVGTGLGGGGANVLFPPCAPGEVSHAEFYRECRPPCYHLVARDYGHLDMLDDDAPKLVTGLCKQGSSDKDVMRRTVAGIMVAFLRSALGEEDSEDLKAILGDPGLAPTTLDPVEYRLA